MLLVETLNLKTLKICINHCLLGQDCGVKAENLEDSKVVYPLLELGALLSLSCFLAHLFHLHDLGHHVLSLASWEEVCPSHSLSAFPTTSTRQLSCQSLPSHFSPEHPLLLVLPSCQQHHRPPVLPPAEVHVLHPIQPQPFSL